MVTNNSNNYKTGASATVLTGNGVGVTPTFQSISAVTSIAGTDGISTTASTGAVSILSRGAGTHNTFLGQVAGNATLGGSNNTSLGWNSLHSLINGSSNCALGSGALSSLGNGNSNICLGLNSGATYSGESNNILIGTNISGETGDSGVVNINNFLNNVGDANVFLGESVPFSSASVGSSHVAIGAFSGSGMTSGSNENTYVGYSAATMNIGSSNVVVGGEAGVSSGDFSQCTYIGTSAVSSGGTGDNNIAIGYMAATNWIGSENGNIAIGSSGVASETSTIRIGESQTSCFIQGINGVTVTGTAVLCATNGQLGTVLSSERYKKNIQTLEKESEKIFKLRPVSFIYRSDKNESTQYGLIAEEVNEAFPYLVVCDSENRPSSVKYHELPALLLNEIQKLRKRIDELENKILI